jgi:23S rRNA (adenine2503-C2)-methyltransferase
MKKLILDLTPEGISSWLLERFEPHYREAQIWAGLYKHYLTDFNDFSNLSKTLKAALSDAFTIMPLIPMALLKSKDGFTEKTLFALPDGAMIETVLMRYNARNSLCISTQSGCAMGCSFCATGQMGFTRHLSSGEIIAQVLHFERYLREKNEHLTNIVLMGMGEPFHNYDASISAIRRLNDPDGFNMGARRFTISTVGLVPRIKQFAEENLQANLAISLHAAEDELRSSLVPMNRIYPILQLMQACRYYLDKTNRRITFEYALIEGVNDSESHARALADLLSGLLCHVNLIALNPTRGYQNTGTKPKQVEAFMQILVSKNIQTTIRLRRGIEIQAGCGQLAYLASPML